MHLPMDTDGGTEAQRLPCSRLQSLAEAGLKRGLSLLFKLGVGLFTSCSTPLPAHIPTSWNPVWTLRVTVSSFPESQIPVRDAEPGVGTGGGQGWRREGGGLRGLSSREPGEEASEST